MASPLRHVAEIARGAATRRSLERADVDAQVQLEVPTLDDLPPGLTIRWLGVAGSALAYAGETLLVDPYVSRVPLRALLRREPALPDLRLIDTELGDVGTLAGILVGHTHFDHAVDAPAIARRFGAPALGSRSLVNLMRLHGLAHLAREVEAHKPIELGPFTVRFVPSRHSKLLLGLAVPFAGELTCAHLDALCPSAYRCGQVWGIEIEVAGLRIYHQGSADLIDEEIRRPGVDIFLAGIAGRNFTEDYFARVLRRLQPRVVVPSHYDDFFKPLHDGLRIASSAHLNSVPAEIAAVSTEFEVAALPYPRVAASNV